MSSKVIGIEWFEGDITPWQLLAILRNIPPTVQTLYTADAENAKLIESITARNVVDLSSKGFDASLLRTRDIFCYHHNAIQEEQNFLCALTLGKNINVGFFRKKKYSL